MFEQSYKSRTNFEGLALALAVYHSFPWPCGFIDISVPNGSSGSLLVYFSQSWQRKQKKKPNTLNPTFD